jgi:hypothetical protein
MVYKIPIIGHLISHIYGIIIHSSSKIEEDTKITFPVVSFSALPLDYKIEKRITLSC